MTELRRLGVRDLDSYYANRLRGLADSPDAFLTTLDEEEERGHEHFRKTLSNIGNDQVIFGALVDGEVVGTIGVFREERQKIRHKATIWGMYVDVAHRRKGIGAKLLDIAIEHAREKIGVECVYLSVEAANIAAKSLYLTRGFRAWGKEPKAMLFRGNYSDEIHMVLKLDPELGEHKQLPTLETERLVLRPFKMSDAKDVYRMCGDERIARGTANIPHPYPPGAAEEWISTHQATFDKGAGYCLAVTLKSTGDLIGANGLFGTDGAHHRGEIGYWIGVDFWNKGYATESSQAVLRYGFEVMNLNKIIGRHIEFNPASGLVMKKIGMTKEGHLVDEYFKFEKFHAMEVYGITQAQWRKLLAK